MEDKKEIGNVQIYNSGQINLATDHGVIWSTQNNENHFSENGNRIAEKCHEYAERYEEELPSMGDDSISVSLKQLYVEPEYSLMYPYESKKEGLVFSYLKEFLHSEEKKNKKILFVEGDAGIGKTSLVSKIAHHYEHPNKESELGNDFFIGTRLICVRLRDMLDKNQTLNIENPWEDIFQYLNISKRNRRNESKKRSVLILDGFDELCMVESIQSEKKLDYFINLLRNLQSGRIHWKVIVTSRLNYIGWEDFKKDLKDCMEIVQLQHFSIEKRNRWIERAKEARLPITEEVKQGMIDSNRKELEAIIGVPWTLYLVARKAIIITADSNLWEIYNSIFKGENVIRSFEEDVHPTRSLQNDLYRITEEIAFWMYQNQCFDITLDTIENLIDGIYEETEQEKKLCLLIQLKDTYALHTYYRRTDQRGGLAFYHNYIQDFFLCEYVFYELNRIYVQLEQIEEFSKKIDYLIKCYTRLFLSGLLNENTVQFIQSRIAYEYERAVSKWINTENEARIFALAFEDMIMYGFRRPAGIKKLIMEVIRNLLYNCWNIYDYLYSLQGESHLYLKILEKNKNELGEFRKIVIENLLRSFKSQELPLDHVNLSRMGLSEIHLNNVNMMETNLDGADLSKIYFKNINLSRSNLSRVNLMEAYLRDIDLRRVYLSGADLTRASLLSACLIDANLERADLRMGVLRGANLIGANLKGADLRKANLIKANLNEANLSRANLTGANLSRANLNRTNLSGAVLNKVKLKFTNLIKVNLENADLTNAILKDVKFIKCIMEGTKLRGVQLAQFDLENSEIISMLARANLKDVNWQGVTIEQKKNLLYEKRKILENFIIFEEKE